MKTKKRQLETPAEVDESDLLGADHENDASELKISQSFAKKYNDKKDREEMARARRVLADEDIGGSSSETSEDENAELLTSAVDHKIFETLAKIKSKDPKIYDEKHIFFDDKDFEEASTPATASSSKAAATGSSEKKVRYKDFLRETLLSEGADAIAKEEEALEAKAKAASQAKKSKKMLTPLEEQRALKADILAAAADGDDDDDNFFTLKKKSTEELHKEDDEFRDFTLRKDKEPGGGRESADDIVSRYYKADEDLNADERFLRDYLLNKGWQETTSLQAAPAHSSTAPLVEDEEDEEHLDDVDEFEKEYNFRFEVEEGSQIQGHARFPEASVRERPDARKRQRKEKAERKQAEKIRRTEELKRLKNLKKEEIRRRLQQLQEITGNEDTALGNVDLDADFDPDQHDKEVGRLLGEGFDTKEEPLAADDLMKAPSGCEADLDVSAAGVEVLERRTKGKICKSGGATDEAPEDDEAGDWEEDADAGAAAAREDEAEPDLWFLCDSCQLAIPGGKKRFDCTVCEDYVLCAKCFRVRTHPHKFVRRKVPERCMPPADFKGKEADTNAVEEMWDEYFQLDYEDIIGGDLPTRFKYRKVESADFGLRPQDILQKTDQELNRIVPLKKLRTYRDDPGAAASTSKAWNGSHKPKRRQGRGGMGTAGAGNNGLSSQRLDAYNFGGGGRGGGKKRNRPQ